MEVDLWMQILFIFVLVLVNAFFAASEISIISLNNAKIKQLADDGDKKAKLIIKLTEEPSKFLATIQVGITLAGFLASASAAVTISDELAVFLNKLNIDFITKSSREISIFLVTIVISYLSLVFGELVPKRVALAKAEGFARFAIGTISVLSKIGAPFVKVLTASTNLILRMFGIDPDSNHVRITEEEIRMMINVGEEKGVLLEQEKEMIDSIFEFDDTFAKTVMTPRTDMVCISVEASLDEIIELTVKEKFSRLPVYEENIDNIIGILNVKDLFDAFCSNKGKKFDVKNYIRPPLFVPENQKTDVLLKTLQEKRTEMAIVIDEYGGTAGLITSEDLVEEIVGSIMDEYDEEEDDFEKVNENIYIVDGMLSIAEVNRELDIEIPEDGADTIGGFILGILGRIPEPDEQPVVNYETITFMIEEMDDRRAAKIKIFLEETKKNDETGEDTF